MVMKWTHEMYVDYVTDNFSDEFEVKGEYKGNQVDILMRHNVCQRDFLVRPGNFKTRKRCSLCHGNFKKSTDVFKTEVEDKVGKEYYVIGRYETAKTNIKLQHKVCNNIYEVTPDDFLNGGNRCPFCAPNRKKTTEIFKREVNDLTEGDYSLIGKYIGSKVPTLFRHNTCNHVFKKAPEIFLIGVRCPECGLKKRTGKNHYRYNFDLTESERLRRDMFNGELRKWRTSVYDRDQHTCRICGTIGGKLNAHHIFSWDKHEKHRFDVENGVTLCESCHKNFHSIYGYGNNNPSQFKEYTASRPGVLFLYPKKR